MLLKSLIYLNRQEKIFHFKQDKTKSSSIARKKKMATLDEFRSSFIEQGIKMR